MGHIPPANFDYRLAESAFPGRYYCQGARKHHDMKPTGRAVVKHGVREEEMKCEQCGRRNWYIVL